MKNKKLFCARLIFTLLSIAAVGAIFYNSSLNADDSQSQSDLVVGINNWLFGFLGLGYDEASFLVRKLAHFTEYAVLGALLSVTVYLYVHRRLRTLCMALPIGLAVAVCDELIQTASEGRSCEFRDVMIDFCGVLTAALAVQLVLYLRGRHKKEGNEIERNDSE